MEGMSAWGGRKGRRMNRLHERFCWYEADAKEQTEKTPEERYQRIVEWSVRARGINPGVFDELTAWLCEGEKWSEDEFSENGRYFTEKIIGGFWEQNKILREELTSLVPAGIVNMVVFDALDRFDDELSGKTHADCLKEAVTAVFRDFSNMRDHAIRKKFAGGVTGPSGTDSVDLFGYINVLKDSDAAVQWALFMPDCVRRQQEDCGFRVESFEYLKFPALRFVGMEKDFSEDPEGLEELKRKLDTMRDYACGFDCDVILLHHYGKCVDMEHCHALWGRFMAANAPVPAGFASIDFVPRGNGAAGVPYLSQFAYARFTGDKDSMHRQEGFDCDAMYDVTRNIILGQNVPIPYPDKYWAAEVYPEGFGKDCTAYLFSVEK